MSGEAAMGKLPPDYRYKKPSIQELLEEIAELRKDAERYRWLKQTLESAKGSASIEVNQELAYYEKPEEGKEVRIQWYPDTPVGFYLVEDSSIDKAIDAAMQQTDKEVKG